MPTTRIFPAAISVVTVIVTVAAAAFTPPAAACTAGDRPLNLGFYAFFAPVSYSANTDPNAPGFHTHRGYEADLVSALEAMPGAGLAFKRRPIAEWDDIWLRPAGDDYDLVGGGITILESRTRDADGARRVAFTAGHIAFRQSLLVRAEDAARLARHDDLGGEVRVGALASTTGEARLLQLTGLADADGILAAGVRVDTPRGTVTADGGGDYFITAAAESPALAGRYYLHPPSARRPQVVYLGDLGGEAELLAALAGGRIDAIARGEIGNRAAARASAGALAVTAVDAAARERGGFALAVADADLRACLDEKIAYLTDRGRIGFAAWLDDPAVFMRRARAWVE